MEKLYLLSDGQKTLGFINEKQHAELLSEKKIEKDADNLEAIWSEALGYYISVTEVNHLKVINL